VIPDFLANAGGVTVSLLTSGLRTSSVPLDARASESRAQGDDYEGLRFSAGFGEDKKSHLQNRRLRNCSSAGSRC